MSPADRTATSRGREQACTGGHCSERSSTRSAFRSYCTRSWCTFASPRSRKSSARCDRTVSLA
eukprot:2636548-Rhodomonas_salina.1